MEQQSFLKRSRDEEEDMSEAISKKQRSFNDLISVLEDDEEEPDEDLSFLITSLQQELCSVSHGYDDVMSNDQNALMGNSSSSSEADSSEIIDLTTTVDRAAADEEEEREKVMRHLLEASDDELGIPNIDGRVDEVAAMDGGDFYGIDDGLFWEFDDEAANNYALLQSELFL